MRPLALLLAVFVAFEVPWDAGAESWSRLAQQPMAPMPRRLIQRIGFSPVTSSSARIGSRPEGTEGQSGDARIVQVPDRDRDLEGLMGEFLSTGKAIANRPGGEAPIDFPGLSGHPSWFQVLTVTRAQNPLLEEDCKTAALRSSVASLSRAKGIEGDEAALAAAAAHMKMHQDFIDKNGISYSGYLRQIGQCHTFCAPLIASLEKCHVLAVARRPHAIVLFGLDRDDVDPRFAAGNISRILERLRSEPERRVILIGRASRIGDLKYNRRLAARRALSVRDIFMEKDIPEKQVETMWFGWEPPQIAPFIAHEYGFEDLYREVGDLAINQSVVMVVY